MQLLEAHAQPIQERSLHVTGLSEPTATVKVLMRTSTPHARPRPALRLHPPRILTQYAQSFKLAVRQTAKAVWLLSGHAQAIVEPQ